MASSIVCIKKIVTDISKLKREHFSENEVGYNEYGVLHEGKRSLSRDEQDIHTLIRIWIDERRTRGIVYTLKNLRMWTVIAIACLLFFTLPLPKRIAFLNWIIPVVIVVCAPILSYLVYCIEIEKRYIEMTGVNELGSLHFNFITGGVYLAQVQIDDIGSYMSGDASDTTMKRNSNQKTGHGGTHYITVGFIAYRSGGDYDEDGDDDSDNESDQEDEKRLKHKSSAANKSCEVAYLYVLPKYRRRGIAELLVESVCKDAIEGGYDMMYFSLPADSDQGLVEFAKSRGFRLVGTRQRLAHRDTYNTKVETWTNRYILSSKTSRGLTRIASHFSLMLRACFNPLSAGIVTMRPTQKVGGPVEMSSVSYQCRLALTGEGAEEDDMLARPLFKIENSQFDILSSRKQLSSPSSEKAKSIKPSDNIKSNYGSSFSKRQVAFALDRNSRRTDKADKLQNEYENSEDEIEEQLSSDYEDDDEDKYEQRLLRRRHLQSKVESSMLSSRQPRSNNRGFVPSTSKALPSNLTFEEELEMLKNSVRHEEMLKRRGVSYLRSSSGRHNLGSEDSYETESGSELSDIDSSSYTVSGVWAPSTSTSENIDTFSSYSGGTGRATGKSHASKTFFERISRQAAMLGSESDTRYVEEDTTKFMDDDQLNFLIRSSKHR